MTQSLFDMHLILPNDITSDDKNMVRANTDALGRNTGKTIEVGDNKIAEEKITYVKFVDHATNMPSNVRFATNGIFNESIQYKYDSMGNIIEVFENGRSACRYEYDALGRLTREDNVAFAKTTTWAYDNNGNIIARYEYAITAKPTNELHLLNATCKLYTYADNSDQLVSFNGEEFIYDTIGNPTTYRGKVATWAYGRQLATYDGNTFTYDARGRRIAKNGITFTYDGNGNLIKQSDGLEFLYDHTGVFAIKHNNTTYFYRKDAQANIVALLDNTGAVVVKYTYDAWGKCTVDASATNTTLANLNPFRYRSYYYDTETNLYFLKTRYYDPEIGRFISPDSSKYLDPESINGLNLYAYCLNNPVMYEDPSGHFVITMRMLVGPILVGALFGGGAAFYSSFQKGDAWYEVALKTISGAALGGMLGAATGLGAALVVGGTIAGLSAGASLAVGFGVSVGGSAFLGATNSFVNQIIDKNWDINRISGSRIRNDALVAGIKGVISFGTGMWTGAAGLWDIPKGTAPGFMNFITKATLNIVIGGEFKAIVDVIYASLIGEECGWVNALQKILDLIF